MVDTYGIARYREMNPAVFTAATFPFLFGVMYGDVGHGMCLFVAAIMLVVFEPQIRRSGVLRGEIAGSSIKVDTCLC